MKLFSNNRQKLTLNRAKKPSTPTKLSMEVINSLKFGTLTNPLANKDTNTIKPGNSSIYKKQIETQAEKRQRIPYNLIRSRSISWMDNTKHNSKIIASFKKINNSTLQQKSSKRRMFGHIIEESCNNMVLSFKQRGILATKNNYYYISLDMFNEMVAELADRIIQETSKASKLLLTDMSSTKDTEPSECSEKHQNHLRVFNQFSINQQFNRIQPLSFDSSNINIHLQYEQCIRQRQSFWKLIEKIDVEKQTEQNFNFLLVKSKYLKEEITKRETQLKRINETIEEYNKNIDSKNQEIQMLQQKIKKHESSLSQVQAAVKDIESFINKQPNKILQQQAQGYKQRQQELFDLAFMLEQSVPSSINVFVQESIMIQFESFKLTLKTFPHGSSNGDSLIIPQKDIEAFKASIDSAYESTVQKLKIIIQRKAAKIKNFVGIMRRLASYTIGKRQYLTQINKKMAIVSINFEKKLKIIQQCCGKNAQNQDKMKILAELKHLFNTIRIIYCQAEVFY